MNSNPDGVRAAAVQEALRSWFSQGLGRNLVAWEKSGLSNALQNLFGYYLVQIGFPVTEDLMSHSRIRNRILLDPEIAPTHRPQIVGRPDLSPIATDSVDVVILPHSLEFEADPHQVLREVERVLIPEGHVVILAFNPWSLWGCWHLLRKRKKQPPWSGRFLGLTRIKDWLALLGFDTVQVTPIFFRPPLHSKLIMRRLRFLEKAGARWWPFLAAVNLVVAKKRVATLTPIKLRSRPQRSVMPEVVKPTSGRVVGE